MARFSPLNWPVVRQLTTPDRFGRGEAVTSRQTRDLKPRTATARRSAGAVLVFGVIPRTPAPPQPGETVCGETAASAQLIV